MTLEQLPKPNLLLHRGMALLQQYSEKALGRVPSRVPTAYSLLTRFFKRTRISTIVANWRRWWSLMCSLNTLNYLVIPQFFKSVNYLKKFLKSINQFSRDSNSDDKINYGDVLDQDVEEEVTHESEKDQFFEPNDLWDFMQNGRPIGIISINIMISWIMFYNVGRKDYG
ncbi:unnamed protein product [Trichogramma brassicae]|uniref:Uncharacterized protein n=1 Tax=Trichogramma brassicae TaxID=86971 RepID=A0A6H5IH27_9HYME|nr:unnamed protein product [Trichogramma brassicae]